MDHYSKQRELTMTVQELIEQLKQFPQGCVVKRFSTEKEGVDWFDVEFVYIDESNHSVCIE